MAVSRTLCHPPVTGLLRLLTSRFRTVLVCAGGLALLLPSNEARASVAAWMTSAATVHDLSRNEAERRRPVHLVGTVTYYDPQRHVMFLQDESGGVYVTAGDLVDVVGTTEPSFHGNVAVDPTIRVIGHHALPRPLTVAAGEMARLMDGKWNSRRATLRAVVRSALIDPSHPDRLDLEMLTEGSVLQASVLHAGGVDPRSLIDSEVDITGTLGANYNAKLQFLCLVIYSNAPGDIKVVRRAAHAPDTLPLTSVDEMMTTRAVLDRTERVRVRGAVTYYRPGRVIVIEQNGRSASGVTWQRTPLPLGSVVDLSGFAYQGEFGPVLKQVMFTPTGTREEIGPLPLTYARAMTGRYNDELISVRGRVVSQNHGDLSDTLTLLVDGHSITADLQQPIDGRWLASIRPGSTVEVAGICRVTLTTTWDRPRSMPAFFRIDLRSADDLKVLSLPSWWTMDHLLKMFELACFASLVLTLWAMTLRRRVSRQTEELKRSMHLEQERSRMLQAISSDAPLQHVLEDLCASCDSLMPDVRCGCEVVPNAHPGMEHFEAGVASAGNPDLPLYEARMEDGHGGLLGHYRAAPDRVRPLTPGEREIFDVFAALATLAVNQRRMYQELNYTSTHDQLTGLPNRRLADACLERALLQRSRSGTIVAVVYIDVDHFKQVNDQHGHKTGDQYLQLIATRMRGAVRSSDTLARIGGDEFLLVAAGLRETDEAERYRSRLRACFAEPFVLDGVSIAGSASIGIATAPDHGTSPEELKRKADLDMYAAKHQHRTGTDMRTVSLEREAYTVSDLEVALRENRFQLFYQPQFCTDGKLRGLEALLRLYDPARGLVTPDAFIGVAERNDLIHPLGAWVLCEALRDAVRWRLPSMNARMMVNISMRQAEHPDFAASVMRMIEGAGIAATCVELEITERMLMHDMPQAIAQLSRLRAQGVHIAIDDFGVEHSSLSVLHHLPFDTLKLDRTFIRAMNDDVQATHIVGAIVSMAHGLGKRVVAEGVETQAHVQALAPFCEVDLQGYYFSRPRPAEEIAHALKTWCSSMTASPAEPAGSQAAQAEVYVE